MHTPHTNSRLAFSVALGPKGAMLSPPYASFRDHYQSLIASGAIEPDAAQAEAAEAFAGLERRLTGYKPLRKQSLLGRLFADKDEPPPRGLYVYGEVGRGKTMLMDLFFQQSRVPAKTPRAFPRIHVRGA